MSSQAAENYDAATRKILAQIRDYIGEQYGPRCKPVDGSCSCCKAWKLYDQFRKLIVI